MYRSKRTAACHIHSVAPVTASLAVMTRTRSDKPLQSNVSATDPNKTTD